MLEGLWFDLASRAGWVWGFVRPGGVRGQIALCRSHLVDSSRHKLAQPHQGVWVEGGGVLVVRGRSIIAVPVLDKHVPGAGSEGQVSPFPEVRWGNVRPGWGGGV